MSQKPGPFKLLIVNESMSLCRGLDEFEIKYALKYGQKGYMNILKIESIDKSEVKNETNIECHHIDIFHNLN